MIVVGNVLAASGRWVNRVQENRQLNK